MLIVELADPYVRVIYPLKTISVDIAVMLCSEAWRHVAPRVTDRVQCERAINCVAAQSSLVGYIKFCRVSLMFHRVHLCFYVRILW